jgi:hypothetical protein
VTALREGAFGFREIHYSFVHNSHRMATVRFRLDSGAALSIFSCVFSVLDLLDTKRVGTEREISSAKQMLLALL